MEQSQIIFSSKLAKILIKNGFKVKDIAPNRTSSERSVYYFENSEGLADIISIYVTSQRLKKQNQSAKAI